MAKRKGSTKKQDETLVDIVEVRENAQDFFERNQRLILGIVGAIVILAGGIFAYKVLYLKPRQKEAIQQMFQAEIQFQRDSFALALTNPGGGYSGFLDIIDNYGGTPAANLAEFYAGISYLNLGEFEAAISYLEDYKPAGQITPALKYGALGDAWSELNDFGKAMNYYKKAAKAEENDLLTPYYLKKIGLLQEREGNYKDALETYKKIKEKYPQPATSQDAQELEKLIYRAEAQL